MMKRFNSSSSSFSALISYPSSKEEKKRGQGYSREFQAMLDSLEQEEEEEDFGEETGLLNTKEKKRRLSLHKVKALEKNFEVENKLDPERKLKLAQELDLKPRQVAIWFQNRRARLKIKQLERDYGTLKANYEALQVHHNNLGQENEALTLQLKDLKAKIREEKCEEANISVKEEEPIASESENNVSMQSNVSTTSNALINWIQKPDSRTLWSSGYNNNNNNNNNNNQVLYQHHVVKLEEQLGLFDTEESCNFFSVDQAPSLRCYFPEQ